VKERTEIFKRGMKRKSKEREKAMKRGAIEGLQVVKEMLNNSTTLCGASKTHPHKKTEESPEKLHVQLYIKRK